MYLYMIYIPIYAFLSIYLYIYVTKLLTVLVFLLGKRMNLLDGTTPDLPSDIIAEIFLRLPVKSLCRFKCASIPWRSLISNPQFARNHFNRNKNTQNQPSERLFSISRTLECRSLDLESSKSTAVELSYTQTPIQFKKIWNSCDGLLLLSDLHSLFLVNPSTRECRKLPPYPFFVDSDGAISNHGFGFDLSINDYKVVRISIRANHFLSDEIVVSIYNLRTNSWRRINSHPHSFYLPIFRDGIFINGSLHWLGKENIVSLSLASESFQSMPLPRSAGGVYLLSRLNVMNGCLCGFELGYNFWEPIDVWVMREYGVGDSWVKFTVHYPPMKFISPLRAGKLLLCRRQNMVVYDPLQGEVKELTVGDSPLEAISYEESLIRLEEYGDEH